MENVFMLNMSLWSMSIFSTNAACSCFCQVFGGNSEGLWAWDWPSFCPTLFLSLQFRNLTFTSTAVFQTFKKCQNVPKICMSTTRKWWAPVFAGVGMHLEMSHHGLPASHERKQRCKVQTCLVSALSSYTGFYLAGKANPVFPGKKMLFIPPHKD